VRRRVVAAVLAAASLVPAATPASPVAEARSLVGEPVHLSLTVPQGQLALRLTWDSPNGLDPGDLLGYQVQLGSGALLPVSVPSILITDGLVLGRTYTVSVRALTDDGPGEAATASTQLFVNPVTTPQAGNPDNPLAGHEWGVYRGDADPAYAGWRTLDQGRRDQLALLAMTSKAKYFGSWISDSAAYTKTDEYIRASQAGDPERLTFMTLFRMDPWEGEIRNRLPDAAERRSYKDYVRATARAIGDRPVAVVVQPDGYFAKIAYDAHRRRLGERQALLPARMLRWTMRTLSRQPRAVLYLDMGSEDWARGNVGAVATFLARSGVAYGRGFALNVSHKNYLDREVRFARRVSRALADAGLPGKRAVLDTSDNGHPFSGAELNPGGHSGSNYTPPGDVAPCRRAGQTSICTALGVPPTTDVDNPAWGLAGAVARTAARYVDAYLWISRPWLPHQGAGGTTFSATFAGRLMRTHTYSPFFAGTP
jgi:endoglucanase